MTSVKPKYIPFKCPNCNGYGTISYGKYKCKVCDGKGYLIIDQRSGQKVDDDEKEKTD
jgi:DnaJ-class molecular chaperone